MPNPTKMLTDQEIARELQKHRDSRIRNHAAAIKAGLKEVPKSKEEQYLEFLQQTRRDLREAWNIMADPRLTNSQTRIGLHRHLTEIAMKYGWEGRDE